jgi:hypothetical protein
VGRGDIGDEIARLKQQPAKTFSRTAARGSRKRGASSSCVKQMGYLLVPGVLRVLLESCAVSIDSIAQGRKSREISPNERFVSIHDGELGILNLDAEETAALPEIFDCPTGRCSAEPQVASIDVGTCFEKRGHDFTVAIFGRVVQGGCTVGIARRY